MGKNTLWVFGDSFSEDIKKIPYYPENGRWEYINEFLGGSPYLCWGEIISNEIDFEYKNYAAYNSHNFGPFVNGNSNQTMINNVFYFSNQFKKGDIVFLGFTDIVRFIFPSPSFKPQNILPNQINKSLDNEDYRFCENYLIHRSTNSKFYIYEILNYLKPLEILSKTIGFHLFYWTWSEEFENDIENELINDHWIFQNIYIDYIGYFHLLKNKMGVENIVWETNGKIEDVHMGKEGNDAHAKLLLPYIKNLINYE